MLTYIHATLLDIRTSSRALIRDGLQKWSAQSVGQLPRYKCNAYEENRML